MSNSTTQNAQTLFADPQEGETAESLSWLKNQFSPFRLLAGSIVTIIFVTALALLSYEYLVEGHDETLKHVLETTFVSATLLIFIPPLLYIFSYRPLLSNMHKLQQTERKLHLLVTALESADDGIVIADNQGNIQWSNPAFAESVNLTTTDAYGRNLRWVEARQGVIDGQETRWQALLSGRVWREELNIHLHNGLDRIEEQVVTPVRDDNGAISHLIFLEKDITEQRTLEKAAGILAIASQALNQSLNLNKVLESLLDLLVVGVPYDNAAAILVDGDDQYVVRTCRGCEFESRFQVNDILQLADSCDNPQMRTLFREGEDVWIPDTAVTPTWEPFIDGEKSKAGMGVPISIEDEVIGFCVINKHQPNYFTSHHVEITKALVSQAGAAIQNARLFEQVEAGREQLQSLSHRLVEIQETERRFIARELHDEAGQSLASLKLQLLFLEQQANRPDAILTGLAGLKQNVDEIAENLHRLASNLRPASLDHVGLLEALAQHVETISSQYNIIGQFAAVGVAKRLQLEVETAVYRIVQEALTNVIRHAHATRVDVILNQNPNSLNIIIEDNGVGFDPSTVTSNGTVNDHLGLVGIRERTEMLGGIFIVESTLGSGTTLKIEVPYGDSRVDS
ncbi:MAG: PAS domain-containing protein [Ardenticatenaceae bacterium]|nr:PAS domain-containing protein [Ardenticatenaceae bacterium]MCB9445202.1 PAS domain-containing protein [Ardenticatenaceae bacterium]